MSKCNQYLKKGNAAYQHPQCGAIPVITDLENQNKKIAGLQKKIERKDDIMKGLLENIKNLKIILEKDSGHSNLNQQDCPPSCFSGKYISLTEDKIKNISCISVFYYPDNSYAKVYISIENIKNCKGVHSLEIEPNQLGEIFNQIVRLKNVKE